MTFPTVSAVVITHNRRTVVVDCLRSLLSSTHPLLEVVVVDNASTDGTSEHLRIEFPSVSIVSSNRNLLTAAAVNIGFARTSSDFVLAMGDDNVVSPTMIEEMVTVAADTGAAVIGAKNFFKDDPQRIWSWGSLFNLTTGRCRNPNAGEIDHGQCCDVWEPDSIQNVLLIARRAIAAIGGFDENWFPIHNEEADYCYRARGAGLGVVTAPRAHVWHNVSVNESWLRIGTRDFTVESPLRAYYTARNRALLVRKHASREQWWLFATIFHPLASLIYATVILSKRNRWRLLAAYARGTVAAYRMQLT